MKYGTRTSIECEVQHRLAAHWAGTDMSQDHGGRIERIKIKIKHSLAIKMAALKKCTLKCQEMQFSENSKK